MDGYVKRLIFAVQKTSPHSKGPSRLSIVVFVHFQGEYPGNMSEFMKQLQSEDLPSDFLANVQFSVFAMGDSHYVHYNSAGLDLDKRLSELGAQRVKSPGLGDDQVSSLLLAPSQHFFSSLYSPRDLMSGR